MGNVAALASVIANGSGVSGPARVGTRGGDVGDLVRWILGEAARRQPYRDRRAVQQCAGDRADDVAAEHAVARTADHDHVRVLLLREVDQRFGVRLADEHGGGGAHALRRQRVNGLGNPLLASLDEVTLVFGASGMPVGQFLAHDEDDVAAGIEGLGERAGEGDPVVAGRRGQIPDGQMHCWACTFSSCRGP
jgi:hypothetical protein